MSATKKTSKPKKEDPIIAGYIAEVSEEIEEATQTLWERAVDEIGLTDSFTRAALARKLREMADEVETWEY